MQTPARHISSHRRARMSVRRLGTGVVLALAIAASGCSSGVEHASSSPSLLSGNRGQSVSAEGLSPAAHLADRFAIAYARTVYRRRPPPVPGVTFALARELAAAATRGCRPSGAVFGLAPFPSRCSPAMPVRWPARLRLATVARRPIRSAS